MTVYISQSSFNKRTEQYNNTYDMLPTTKTFNQQSDADTTEIGSPIVLDGDFRIYCRFKITGTPNSWQYVYLLSNNNDTTSHEGFSLTIIGDDSNWSFWTIFGIYTMTNEIILSSLLNVETEVELIRTHGVSNQLFVNGVDYSHTYVSETDSVYTLTNTESGSFHTFRFSLDHPWYYFKGEIYECFIEYGRPEPVLGCIDSAAFNYDLNANTDDGTCIDKVFGCTDLNAVNYDSNANVDDENCTYPEPVPVTGVINYCNYPDACNYLEEGDCKYLDCVGICGGKADNIDENCILSYKM